MAMLVHDGHTLEFDQEWIETTESGSLGGEFNPHREFVKGMRGYRLDGQLVTLGEAQAFVDTIQGPGVYRLR